MDTCATNRKTLRIAGDDKPAEVVRSRFMKLNADHICFVLKCLAENSSPIRNMKQYLLASLYNAPTTMQKQKKQAEKEALDPDANYTEDKGDFEIPTEDEPEETGEEDTEPI